MKKEYNTVKREAFDEFTEKKSRFIGYVKPVTAEEEAVAFINEISKKHWDATHNVYAYVLRGNNIRRFSDDGEPQGTAGMPVLDVLLKEDITDCVVVATRYFGGIMLGAGGLVRAYSHCAKVAVEAGEKITMKPCFEAEVNCDYSFYGKLSSMIPEQGGMIKNTYFEDNVRLEFVIDEDSFDKLNSMIIDSSSGKYSAEKSGELYLNIEK